MPFLRDLVQMDHICSSFRKGHRAPDIQARECPVTLVLGRWVSTGGCAPFDVLLVSLNLLLSLEPCCHLYVLVLLVGSSIRVFGIIDMQPFSVLSVEVIGGAEKGNEV